MSGRALLVVALAACGTAAPRPAAPPLQTGGIAGSVRDRDSGEPVSFVSIDARGDRGRASAATDGGGGFRLSALRPGRYHVTARWGVHEVDNPSVLVVAGRFTRIDLRLPLSPGSHPAAALMPGVEVNLRPDAPPVATASATHGGIRGLVRDKVTSEFLAGAVVAASTPGVRDAVLSMADDAGRFRMHALPPGVYTLSAYYQVIGRGAIEVRRTNVRVVAGEITVIDLDLDAQAQP